MKGFFLIIGLTFLFQGLLAQETPSDSTNKKFSYIAGIGVSSQYDAQASPYYRIGFAHKINPKVQFFGTLSHTKKSKGDTFSLVSEYFYNEGQIVASNYVKTSLSTFSIIDFGLGIQYTLHPRFTLSLAPAVSKLTKGELFIDIKEVEVNTSARTYSTNPIEINEVESIKNTLYGFDLGFDIYITKWLSLNCNNHLRFTDMTDDIVYGVRKDRIMQSTISLNYIFR